MFPEVVAIMLCNGRAEMVRRAKCSFESQSYENKRLVILENDGDRSIGRLRNEANASAGNTDIIVHFDSDDWSHPNRIAEQVALLQSSGAECVGYNEMLFWDERGYRVGEDEYRYESADEAWIYRAGGCKPLATNYAIGTSMCYWRKTWEQFPFPDYSPGCDDLYWSSGDEKKGRRAVKIEAVRGWGFNTMLQGEPHVPRMIASVHGSNTCAKIDSTSKGGKEVWTRVPEWDAYCRQEMKL